MCHDRKDGEVAECLSIVVMHRNSVIRTDLVLMCNQLGIELWEIVRKPHILAAILAVNADDNELINCWEKVKENKRAAEEEIAAEQKGAGKKSRSRSAARKPSKSATRKHS